MEVSRLEENLMKRLKMKHSNKKVKWVMRGTARMAEMYHFLKNGRTGKMSFDICSLEPDRVLSSTPIHISLILHHPDPPYRMNNIL